MRSEPSSSGMRNWLVVESEEDYNKFLEELYAENAPADPEEAEETVEEEVEMPADSTVVSDTTAINEQVEPETENENE